MLNAGLRYIPCEKYPYAHIWAYFDYYPYETKVNEGKKAYIYNYRIVPVNYMECNFIRQHLAAVMSQLWDETNAPPQGLNNIHSSQGQNMAWST